MVTAVRQRILRERFPWVLVLLVGCSAICGADEPCARCHPEEAVAFERSPTGSSLILCAPSILPDTMRVG